MGNDKLYEKFDNYKALSIDNMKAVEELVKLLSETVQDDQAKKEKINTLSKTFLQTSDEQFREYKHLLEEYSRVA